MIQLPIFGTLNVPNIGTITLEQIEIDGIAVGDPINHVNLLYFIGVDRIHRIDRTRDVGSIDPDPVQADADPVQIASAAAIITGIAPAGSCGMTRLRSRPARAWTGT